jgi:ParB family chromosome partitioning protein
MRALTGLRQAGMAARGSDGKPPEMPLDRIMRDPDNLRPPLHLRTPEEQQKQRELDASIKKRGVKSPVSLRPHPTLPDIWIINHGHCRYDGAQAAGHATIPYFIDPNFDSYDQVAENLHRSDLSIWAIAEFIARKMDDGDSKGQITERLGKESQNYVTEHLALVDAPNCLHQAHAQGVTSIRTLYDLRRAYDEFPAQIDAWCNGGARISRGTIKQLLDRMRQAALTEQGKAKSRIERGPSQIESPALPPPFSDAEEPAVSVFEQTQTSSSPPCQASPGLRRDVKDQYAEIDPNPQALPVAPPATPPGIRVHYKGKNAELISNPMVKILVQGQTAPIDVPLFDLELSGPRKD